jgi:hypothetical protein
VTVQFPVNVAVAAGVVAGEALAIGVALRPSCAGAERNPEK